MLDHLNWYLVELERRLRKRRTAQDTADFLLETRSHLEERVEDLVSKGMDRASAAKAALADFGDPDSVVRSYSGSMGMSSKVFGLWVAIACIPVVGFLLGVAFWMAKQSNFVDSPFAALLSMPYIALAIVAGLAWRTRRWVAGYVGVVGVVVSAFASAWLVSSIAFIDLKGESFVVNRASREDQITARQQWLATYDKDFATIQRWRAIRNTPEGDVILAKMLSGTRALAPYPSGRGWGTGFRERMLVSDVHAEDKLLIRYRSSGPSSQRMFSDRVYFLNPCYDFKMAKQMWMSEVDNYVVFLKLERISVLDEVYALSTPLAASWGERWQGWGFL